MRISNSAPTNNAAERELRPAVIMRKTNGCNRRWRGAASHALIASVSRTCYKHEHDFAAVVQRVLQSRAPLALAVTSDAPVMPGLSPPQLVLPNALAPADESPP